MSDSGSETETGSQSETETGTLGETYHAALQHGLVTPSDETLVGVVRRPPGWFLDTVDENIEELAPTAELLDTFSDRHTDLKARGMCDSGAHNAAWEELEFDDRYREQLERSDTARAAIESIVDRLQAGENILLVCFENDTKRCHRHELVSIIDAQR